MAQGVLQSHGLEVVLQSHDSTGGFSTVTSEKGSYRLYVEENNVSQAKEILAASINDSEQVDDKLEEEIDPHKKPPNFRLWLVMILVFGIFFALVGANNPMDLSWRIRNILFRQDYPDWRCWKRNHKGIKYDFCETYFLTGEVRFADDFKLGSNVAHGSQKTYCQNGQLRENLNFDNGKLIGHSMGYYCDGTLAYKTTDEDKDGRQKHFYYYPTGELWSTEYWQKDKLDGPISIYQKDGTEVVRWNAAEDVIHDSTSGPMDGEHEYYYENGGLMAKLSFKDGKYDGAHFWYGESGKIVSSHRYRNGKLYGSSHSFFDNEKVEMIMVYDDDILIHEREYDQMGRLIFFADY